MLELASVQENSFVDGPFGSNLKTDDYTDKGIRLIQLQNIGDGFWIDDNRKFTSERKYQELKRHGALPGDIAIAKMADPVGRACIIPPVSEKFLVVADCVKLSPDKNKCDPRYIVSVINHDFVRHQAELKSTGSTRLRINLTKLRTLKIPLPTLPKQRRIAEILDNIDEAIQKTEALIEKLKAMKQGLLHDLLTRGLDENGKLRDPKVHPERFKDSPLGRIPREWVCCDIKSIINFITDYRGKTPPHSTDGIPVITAENVVDGEIRNITKYVTNATYSKWTTRGFHEQDDVIITTEAPVGQIASAPGYTCLLTRRVIALRPAGEKVRKRYLYWYLYWLSKLGVWLSLTHGSTVPRILKPDILGYRMRIPETEEQDNIIEILESFYYRVKSEEEYLAKLKLQKKGLMQDLLTGRVRVRVQEEETRC